MMSISCKIIRYNIWAMYIYLSISTRSSFDIQYRSVKRHVFDRHCDALQDSFITPEASSFNDWASTSGSFLPLFRLLRASSVAATSNAFILIASTTNVGTMYCMKSMLSTQHAFPARLAVSFFVNNAYLSISISYHASQAIVFTDSISVVNKDICVHCCRDCF